MYGVIDMGSNTMRLNIYKYKNDTIYNMLSKKIMAGLAGYVNDEGYMTAQGMEKTVEYLNEFKAILSNIDVKETFVFATASLRNIENSLEATKYIEGKTGFDIDVISGEDEATLDYVGASMKLNLKDGLLVDIGGGSTEIVLYEDGEIKSAISIEIGSLSMHNKYVKDFLPTKTEMKQIEKKVIKEINKIKYLKLPKDTKIICGVGGTVRATCRLKNHIFEISENRDTIVVKDIDKIFDYYFDNRYDFLSHLIKVIPDRLHTIIPGMIILQTISNQYNSEIINVSEYGVREGYLIQMINNKGYSHVQ